MRNTHLGAPSAFRYFKFNFKYYFVKKNTRLDGRGSIPSRDKILFSIPQHPERLWGPPSLLFSGYGVGGPFQGVKQPERVTGHSSPTSAEDKNGAMYFYFHSHVSSQRGA
jgi:hypothetical protein